MMIFAFALAVILIGITFMIDRNKKYPSAEEQIELEAWEIKYQIVQDMFGRRAISLKEYQKEMDALSNELDSIERKYNDC